MANSPHTPTRPPSTSTPSQWIFTKAEILSSPSIKEGMDPQLEATNRSKGANFIDMVGHKLRLHQITIATATMFFHRFYMFRPLSRFHHYEVGASCLFLATKVEENPRKLPDLILMTARVSHKDDSLVMDEQSKEYWRWRDQILFTEEALLEALCFDFDIVHPYDEILALVRRFAPGNSALGKCAWAFINDSHRTTIQIMYPPHVIAAAAFYFARKFTRTTLSKGPDGKEWWVEYGVKLEDLRDAVMLMIETYKELPTLKYSGKYPQSIVSPPETGRATPHLNGAEKPLEQIEKSVEESNGTRKSSEALEVRSSPPKSTSPRPSPQPRRRSTVSPARGGSPPRRIIDSYRPGSPRSGRSAEHRSRSRGNGRRPSLPVDRYSSPDIRSRDFGSKVDTYIPPARKRSIDDAESTQGREKRRKSEDGEMSEGEIR